ncbi:MAG: hypothetical protein Q9225_001696 [Loekoesia sp. 1 TL-2023]
MEFLLLAICAAPIIVLLFTVTSNSLRSQRIAATAHRLGCQPPKVLHHRLPLAFDLIYELFKADRTKVLPEYLRDRFRRAGATTYSYLFLNTTTIFTIDPKNLQAILSTQFHDFSLGSTRRANFLPFLGHGIFTADGEDWERSRSMLRPHFSRNQISDLRLEEVHVQHMIDVLRVQETGWTSRVDLQPLFFRLTLDSATDLLFGKSVDSQRASLGNGDLKSPVSSSTREVVFGKAFDTCSKWLANRARMNEAYWLLDGNEFRTSCKETHRYVDALVESAVGERSERDGSDTRHTFLDSLLEQTSDRVTVRSELINILLAGRDTTAGLLGWLFYILVRHQEIYSKLRGTILEGFGSYENPKEITLAKLKECQYLQHCLNETLRLYPPVPANTRQALKDTTLPRGGGLDGMGKVFVRKGQQVNYTVYALHRREDIWGADVDHFKPDRWIGRKLGWEYLPFNGGPRVCLGRKLSILLDLRQALKELS